MASDGLQCTEPKLLKEETEEFITKILKIDLPPSYPPSIGWINLLIEAFHRKLPFQNISFLSQNSHSSVPKWEDIYKEIILEGKGGLCLSLNIALTAVLSSLGITAYTAAADYVPTSSRGVHVITLIQVKNQCVQVKDALRSKYKHNRCALVTRSKSKLHKYVNYSSVYDIGISRNTCIKSPSELEEVKRRKIANLKSPDNSLYLADVGCGFPTLQAIDLKKDLKKVYVNCGLEYCIVKKSTRYVRMHRRGQDMNESEEEGVNSEGWLPVFSFSLIPRSIDFFQHSMRPIYINRKRSPYFTELHAVVYFSTDKMIAIKCERLIRYLSKIENVSVCNDQNVLENHNEEESLTNENIVLESEDMLKVLCKYFPMIPRLEIKKAVSYYYNSKNNT